MAFNLDNPANQLAWDIANRNAEAEAAARKYISDQTAMQNASKLIAPYGGDIADYQGALGQSDAAAKRRADMAALYKNYVIGRPELLAGAAAEKRRSGGGTGSAYSGYTPQMSVDELVNLLLGNTSQPQRVVAGSAGQATTPGAATSVRPTVVQPVRRPGNMITSSQAARGY